MNIESSLKLWIETKLSVSTPFLGNCPPCPYAKEAFFKKRISIDEATPQDLYEKVEIQLQNFNREKEIQVAMVVVSEWQKCPAPQITEFVKKMRDTYFHHDLWLLYDHPELKENIGNFEFNHGSLLIFMIQKLSHLVSTSEELEKTGYYKQWPMDYYEEVVGLRRKYYERLKKLNLNETVRDL